MTAAAVIPVAALNRLWVLQQHQPRPTHHCCLCAPTTGALYVTLPMVRSRGKPTTYHNMRVPVQNFCGRDFQVCTRKGKKEQQQQLSCMMSVLISVLTCALQVHVPGILSNPPRASCCCALRCPAQVKHVQQIKALHPEALGWDHVLAVNPTTKRQEQQLVISMPTDPANPKQPVDTTQMQQAFFQRLQQHQVRENDSVLV